MIKTTDLRNLNNSKILKAGKQLYHDTIKLNCNKKELANRAITEHFFYIYVLNLINYTSQHQTVDKQ